MYVPSIYQSEDQAWLNAIVRRYPLATLTTNGPRVPYATHLPVIFASDTASHTSPVGATLLGHMNRNNPHWEALRDGGDAQLVFTGPHSYITPELYQTTPAVPTWNFVSVHLGGKLQPIDDFEQTLDVVRRTVEIFEDEIGSGWNAHDSLDHFREIGPAVGAFHFEVQSADGMFKLSQEKDPETRQRIAERFKTVESGTRHELGLMMHEYGGIS